MRKIIFRFCGILLIGFLLIGTLFSISDHLNHEKNGFIRLFPPHVLSKLQVFKITGRLLYFAGADAKRVYIGSYANPDHLFVFNPDSATIPYDVTIQMPDSARMEKQKLTISIDTGNVYLVDANDGLIWRKKSREEQFDKLKTLDLPFDMSIPLSDHAFAIRIYEKGIKQNILARECFSPLSLEKQSRILEKQVDGIFCTDGLLVFSPALRRVVYTYYYRNQFIVMDTNLNVIFKSNTIDTIRRVQISVTKLISENHTSLFSSPPLVVNKSAAIAGDWLCIHSVLRANNEDPFNFKNRTVIDIYSLLTGKYHFSFYIADYKGEKMKKFLIDKDRLFAIYDDYLLMAEVQL